MRGAAAAEECPRSLVTPASVEFVEKFFASKVSIVELTAREVEAFLILEKEWRGNRRMANNTTNKLSILLDASVFGTTGTAKQVVARGRLWAGAGAGAGAAAAVGL